MAVPPDLTRLGPSEDRLSSRAKDHSAHRPQTGIKHADVDSGTQELNRSHGTTGSAPDDDDVGVSHQLC
jgi:hypothetical protein